MNSPQPQTNHYEQQLLAMQDQPMTSESEMSPESMRTWKSANSISNYKLMKCFIVRYQPSFKVMRKERSLMKVLPQSKGISKSYAYKRVVLLSASSTVCRSEEQKEVLGSQSDRGNSARKLTEMSDLKADGHLRKIVKVFRPLKSTANAEERKEERFNQQEVP